ncbi:MAG TPA: L-serine ammonia-lyase, iron-sulfur-dependent, subunit alpha [Negativicutes bacterium]|nr:L-serine ammonia-lyase, iron-sulfur-dependent, subunit alpha [Negativicutes bacterium]
MNTKIYQSYLAILNSELVVAMGCTEPIAIAYAGAKARTVLGQMPEHCMVYCSGNIVKNAKGVTVPNSGGLKGIMVAAILGIVGGDATRNLAVLDTVTAQDIALTQKLLAEDFFQCELLENVAGLLIQLKVSAGQETAEVVIEDYHSNIVRITKNGEDLFVKQNKTAEKQENEPDKALLTVKDILAFADQVKLEDVEDLLALQIRYNTAISQEGLDHPYGAQVGRTLMADFDSTNVKLRAKAAAAAGSDARMSGCALPVVINSGSGNQGITVTMPVVEYAREYGANREQLYRALVVSNLVAIHQKKYIGCLSAYCGAVSAACGSGAGIAYLLGCTYEEICTTITSTIATIGGMVCDGAKPSCAAKIASAVDAALMALHLSRKNLSFQPGEGLVNEDIEQTILNIGRMGREGMKSTDIEILNIMLGK